MRKPEFIRGLVAMTVEERDELRAENERLRAVAQAANDAYLAWTTDRSQEDLDACMTILCALLDTWDTWREQKALASDNCP
jgi:hypothetical protein